VGRPPARRGRRRRRVPRLEAALLTLRNRELLNLVVVGVLTGIGFASVYIARQSVVSWASLSYAAFFLALYLAAHLVARVTVPNADPYLLPMAALLTAVGLTEIYRLGPDDAFKQALWVVIGVGLFSATLLLARHDYRRLESYKYTAGIAAVLLLALPALPLVGETINGARLWVHAGPLRFQPGEFAKLALIVFLAGYLREKREVLAQGRLKDFGPLLVIWGAAMLVLFETKDLGGGLLYFGIFLAMLYVATARLAYVLGGLALFVGGSAALYHVVPRVRERVSNWIDPFAHATSSGYQTIQGLYSMAAGGYGGTGFGRGTIAIPDAQGHAHTIIPFANTDFIYATLAQELGLVGIAAFLLVYMLFALRGMRVALLAQDGFSKLLAAGLTFAFSLQTFIIVGGITRIIPLTGITLPFVSYGGSSVVANFVLLAGLLLVSHRANTARGEAA
jgi:cell division protein FtsW (lipid II flippase)